MKRNRTVVLDELWDDEWEGLDELELLDKKFEMKAKKQAARDKEKWDREDRRKRVHEERINREVEEEMRIEKQERDA